VAFAGPAFGAADVMRSANKRNLWRDVTPIADHHVRTDAGVERTTGPDPRIVPDRDFARANKFHTTANLGVGAYREPESVQQQSFQSEGPSGWQDR
jgi:hypothetical protein